MARKHTTRLTVECLEGRDAPSIALTLTTVLPAPKPVVVATQAAGLPTAPVQTQTVAGPTKAQVGPVASPLPAPVADAIFIGFNPKFGGIRLNHNQTLVRIGARKRGRKS